MERDLLQQNGHQVILYERTNDEIRNISRAGMLKVALSTIESRESYLSIKEIVAREKPNLAHFHNTFPLISPLAYSAVKEADIPVIQTLHNFRIFCANGLFLRNGRICEDCMGKAIPWPAVVHKCYRESRPASLAVASMQTLHNLKRTWIKDVDQYIALSEYGKQIFTRAGLPQEKISIKPNFFGYDPPSEIQRATRDMEYCLFIGRLSPEKGVQFLIDAWKEIPHIPLKIVGDGPLYNELQKEISKIPSHAIDLVGWLNQDQIFQILKRASFLVFPSLWYENFPIVLLEAFASGVAVITSDFGVAKEIVDHQKTGLHYKSGRIDNFISTINWAWKNPEILLQYGLNARDVFKERYSAKQNYNQLMSIYQSVLP